jgi:hypothetical protein
MRFLAAAAALAVGLAGVGVAFAVNQPPNPPAPSGTTITSASTTTSTVAPPPTVGESGLVGYVGRGPTSPNCSVTEPCFRPAKVTLQFWRLGRLRVIAATKAATGKYRIALRPGRYTVRISRDLGFIKPSTVRVPVGQFKRVDFTISTGIY